MPSRRLLNPLRLDEGLQHSDILDAGLSRMLQRGVFRTSSRASTSSRGGRGQRRRVTRLTQHNVRRPYNIQPSPSQRAPQAASQRNGSQRNDSQQPPRQSIVRRQPEINDSRTNVQPSSAMSPPHQSHIFYPPIAPEPQQSTLLGTDGDDHHLQTEHLTSLRSPAPPPPQRPPAASLSSLQYQPQTLWPATVSPLRSNIAIIMTGPNQTPFPLCAALDWNGERSFLNPAAATALGCELQDCSPDFYYRCYQTSAGLVVDVKNFADDVYLESAYLGIEKMKTRILIMPFNWHKADVVLGRPILERILGLWQSQNNQQLPPRHDVDPAT
ncbi:hypothetical protein G7046_g7023 [Stylonectria norvegica]|nr:hypothetical protein G7046_g7023 [Stylonectria norvegica]